MKLFYFDMRSRAEVPRIMLRCAGREFEDVRFSFEEWAAKYKALSPTGQAPWLELDDGTLMAQSIAIYTYVADTTGFMPQEPLQRARTLELFACFDDVLAVLVPTFHITDKDEQIKARRVLLTPEGAMSRALTVVEKLLASIKTEFYCGEELSLADLVIFVQHSSATSGMIDGLEPGDWKKYPCIAAMHSKVAAHPKILPLYADCPSATGYHPTVA